MKRWIAIRLLSVTLLLLSLAVLSRASPAAAAPVGSYLYHIVTPPVIFNDGVSSTTLEVVTTGQGIKSVLLGKGASDKTSFISMFNDGTHGDRAANDPVWTLNAITSNFFDPHPRLSWGGTHATWGFALKIVKSDGTEEINYEPTLALVAKEQRFPAVKAGSNLYATEYAFFIVDPSGETLDASIPLGDVKCGKVAFAAYQKLYAVFPDQFDFLTVMPSGAIFDPARNYAENVPYFVAAKNEVRNIGIPLFNDTAKFGSKGRLIGTIYHSFGDGQILDHETGHAWTANFGRALGVTDEPALPGTTARYHWNSNTDIAGQMSAFVFAPGVPTGHLFSNGDGTFRLEREKGNANPYSKLDLYLMGLIPPSEVPPIHKLVKPNFSDPKRVTAERIETYPIQQLMQAEGGERILSWKDSPKSFNFGLIAVKNTEFTDAEFAFFSLVARYFASTQPGDWELTTFYAATGGRATLNARLTDFAPDLKIPPGSPAPWEIPTPTPTRSATPTLPPTALPTRALSLPTLAPTSTPVVAAVAPTTIPPAPAPVAPAAPALPQVGCLPALAVIGGAGFVVRRRARPTSPF